MGVQSRSVGIAGRSCPFLTDRETRARGWSKGCPARHKWSTGPARMRSRELAPPEDEQQSGDGQCYGAERKEQGTDSNP